MGDGGLLLRWREHVMRHESMGYIAWRPKEVLSATVMFLMVI